MKNTKNLKIENGRIDEVVDISKISSIIVEEYGLLTLDILVEKEGTDETTENLKVIIEDDQSKILELPFKFRSVILYGSLISSSPRHLGLLSYGRLHYGGMLLYNIIEINDHRHLQIFLSVQGRPVSSDDVYEPKKYYITNESKISNLRGSSKIHKCPICFGKTTVPNSLYLTYTTDDSQVTCKSCNGKGYVVI